jgi:isoquinoline 1-oxidoreductase beta subunit
VQAQIQSGIIFGTTAALYGEITLKNGSRRSHSFKNGVTVSVERQQALRPCVRGSD